VPFHEAYSYVLDAFPMMVAILALAVVHPGRTLMGPESEFPRISRKERKALKKDKKAAKKEQRLARKEGRKGEKTTSSIKTQEREILDV
jgi:RTA1 like protein